MAASLSSSQNAPASGRRPVARAAPLGGAVQAAGTLRMRCTSFRNNAVADAILRRPAWREVGCKSGAPATAFTARAVTALGAAACDR